MLLLVNKVLYESQLYRTNFLYKKCGYNVHFSIASYTTNMLQCHITCRHIAVMRV